MFVVVAAVVVDLMMVVDKSLVGASRREEEPSCQVVAASFQAGPFQLRNKKRQKTQNHY